MKGCRLELTLCEETHFDLIADFLRLSVRGTVPTLLVKFMDPYLK